MEEQAFVDQIKIIVKDGTGHLSENDYHVVANEAAKFYSQDRPREVIYVYPGGAYDYELPTSWIEGFSTILSIEYPFSEEASPRSTIETLAEEDFLLRRGFKNQIQKLLLHLNIKLGVNDKFGMLHTTFHALDTIPETDFHAVCNLGAGLALRILANRLSQYSDSSIGADSVDYRNKGDLMASRSKECIKLYSDYIGKTTEEVEAAMAIREFDVEYLPGVPYLTHPPESR